VLPAFADLHYPLTMRNSCLVLLVLLLGALGACRSTEKVRPQPDSPDALPAIRYFEIAET
jgi:hypothetical protein